MAIDRLTFLKRRQQGIGGSDIAAIAGLSPWRSAVNVYLDKIQDITEAEVLKPTGSKAPLYWGIELESLIGKAYTLTTGRKIRRHNGLIVDAEYPYFIGDVDFLAYTDDGKVPTKRIGGKTIIVTDKGIEIKTTRYFDDQWGAQGTDEVPLQYLCQVQWYMMLCPSIKSFDTVVLAGGSELRIYTVCRNEAIIAKLREIGKAFWENNVQKQVPPPPTTMDEVKRLFAFSSKGSQVVASTEAENVCERYRDISAQRLALEKQEKELKDQIAVEMQDKEVLLSPLDNEILATFKTESRGRVLRIRSF